MQSEKWFAVFNQAFHNLHDFPPRGGRTGEDKEGERESLQADIEMSRKGQDYTVISGH